MRYENSDVRLCSSSSTRKTGAGALQGNACPTFTHVKVQDVSLAPPKTPIEVISAVSRDVSRHQVTFFSASGTLRVRVVDTTLSVVVQSGRMFYRCSGDVEV